MWILTNEDAPAAADGGADAAAAAAQGAGNTPPAAGTPAAGEGGAPGDGGKLIQPPPAGEGGDPKPPVERIPEKYQVKRDDGTLDADASWAKMIDGHEALQRRFGAGDLAPEKVEDYKLEAPTSADGKPIEGLDFEAFTSDPLFQGFKERAHAEKLTNKQLQFVTNEYLQLAPELMKANAELSTVEAKAELGKLWTDEAVFNKNLQSVSRAIQGFGGEAADMPGSRTRLFEKFGNDPDFIAFAAKVAGEMGEDKVPVAGQPGEVDIEALMKSEAYWKPEHPDHASVKAKVDDFHARKYGTQPKR